MDTVFAFFCLSQKMNWLITKNSAGSFPFKFGCSNGIFPGSWNFTMFLNIIEKKSFNDFDKVLEVAIDV